MKLRAGGWLIMMITAATSGRAESWQTTGGEKIEGRLSGVYGPIAVIADKKGTLLVPLQTLRDPELLRVADYLAARPATILWQDSASKVAKAVKGRLQVLRNGKFADFDLSGRREPDFFLVYFGANWCPPCRAFSPTLVTAYERLRKLAPGRFEVVFVSSDNSSGEMLDYAKHAAMPWPVLKYSQRGRADAIERWAGRGIPCLVAITSGGEVLFHSYRGDEYIGPQAVLRDFEELLRSLDDSSPVRRRSLHRLAVMQHVRAAAGGPRAAAAYVISLDLRRYQTLEMSEVLATLALNEKGEVTDASFTPQIPTVLDYQLVKDASTWLFLPAVENGQPVSRSVQLPLKLRR